MIKCILRAKDSYESAMVKAVVTAHLTTAVNSQMGVKSLLGAPGRLLRNKKETIMTPIIVMPWFKEKAQKEKEKEPQRVRYYFYAGINKDGNHSSGTLTVTGEVSIKRLIKEAREAVGGGALTSLNLL